MNITLKIDAAILEKIKKAYAAEEVPAKGAYVIFRVERPGLLLLIYQGEKKDALKAVFRGEDALKEARRWDPSAIAEEPKRKALPRTWCDTACQIGSDEVGTGDFFGPITVCAAYLPTGAIRRLQELGVADSKKLSDEHIRKIGPLLIKEFSYSQLALSPSRLNDLLDAGENMNSIKAKMHNQVLLNLKRRHPGVEHIYQDQFVEKEKYYSYLTNEKVVVRKVIFKTNGESLYPAIALASVIARYSFLRKMDRIARECGVPIPFGAGKDADETARKIMNEKGKAFLGRYIKKHFRNYKRISDSGGH